MPEPQGDFADEEFRRLWLMGISAERTLGKPKEWDGKDAGFDTFAFKFENWLSGLPGNVIALLDEASLTTKPIEWSVLSARQCVMAAGVSQALKSLVDGRALDICRQVEPKMNGFECWRRLWAEYRPQTA